MCVSYLRLLHHFLSGIILISGLLPPFCLRVIFSLRDGRYPKGKEEIGDFVIILFRLLLLPDVGVVVVVVVVTFQSWQR